MRRLGIGFVPKMKETFATNLCKMCGYSILVRPVRIFVTGGIGGVHRGASESWDVSADLIEFS